LHLPADKRFLAEQAHRGTIAPATFLQRYADYCRRSQFARAQLRKMGAAAPTRPA
jgi:hypothetical protein